MLEREVERWLTARVKRMGGLSFKWICPGQSGVPDRIVVWPGGAVDFVELKTDSGRLSKIQERQIENLQNQGANAWVLHGRSEVDRYIRCREVSLGISSA